MLASRWQVVGAPRSLPPLPPQPQPALSAGVSPFGDAIEARTELSSAQRADHLAVLWFVAEAENVPAQLMKVYISKERLMESSLYRMAFEEGAAAGRAEALAGMLFRILTHHLGALEPALRERIRTFSDPDTLQAWCEEAAVADAEAARRLSEKILRAPAT